MRRAPARPACSPSSRSGHPSLLSSTSSRRSFYPYPRAEIRDNWSAALADPTRSVLVAEDEEPVGVVCAGAGWLVGLYVVPERSSSRAHGGTECRLWVLESNQRARRFYERRGWRENGDTRAVPYPPNPIDVGYTIELETTLATP